MARTPTMLGRPQTNVPHEDVYRVRATIGASGAVSSYRCVNATFAQSSTGVYTLTLPQTYKEITHFSWGFKDAAGAHQSCTITSDAVSTTGVITFETVSQSSPDTPADPASGDVLYITIGVTKADINTPTQS